MSGGYDALLEDLRADTVVYAPPRASRRRMSPDLEDAAAVFGACARVRVRRLVLISSAMAYGASPHNQGLAGEARTPACGEKTKLARAWRELEALAARARPRRRRLFQSAPQWPRRLHASGPRPDASTAEPLRPRARRALRSRA
jgi:nucleoside-diphosphate-sugar epimerase